MAAFAPDGGVGLIVVRAAAVAAMLSTLGGLTYRAAVARGLLPLLPAAEAALLDARLRRLLRGSLGFGVVALLVWLTLEAADMAGARAVGRVVAVLPVVLLHTSFGHLVAAQVTALALCLALSRRPTLALCLAAGAVALQVGHDHAASMEGGPVWLVPSDLAHLLAAGIWLGGLLPLLVTLRSVPAAIGRVAAGRFSPLGKACVLILAVTAVAQGWLLAGGLAGLVGTDYGGVLMVKLALFATLVGFAVVNQYRLVPRLPVEGPARLVRSVAAETLVGFAVIVAAATLSALPPGMHAQPWWPFDWRFSLATVHEDAGFRNEALGATLALSAAVVLLVVATLLRRWRRWLAVAAALGIAWLAIPHLDLLFVPAYPTSFYHSPTGFTTAAITEGAALYPTHCAACHGPEGRGNGPVAADLPVPPADLTAGHLWMHSDGELFWWLAHGITAPDGRQAMPGFAGSLSADQRWALIDFIRGRNAGLAFARSGEWPQTLRAPNFAVRCADGGILTLGDLRGGFVRLVDGPAQAIEGVTTVQLDGQGTPGPGLCIGNDESAAPAYAIVSGIAPDRMPGTAFLVDADGWLRAVQPVGGEPGWNTPATLPAEIAALKRHRPVVAAMPMNMKM